MCVWGAVTPAMVCKTTWMGTDRWQDGSWGNILIVRGQMMPAGRRVECYWNEGGWLRSAHSWGRPKRLWWQIASLVQKVRREKTWGSCLQTWGPADPDLTHRHLLIMAVGMGMDTIECQLREGRHHICCSLLFSRWLGQWMNEWMNNLPSFPKWPTNLVAVLGLLSFIRN